MCCQINAEELSKNQQLLEMKFSAAGLDKKVIIGLWFSIVSSLFNYIEHKLYNVALL